MITTNPLFLLTKISQSTRSFIAGSIIACYGLFLYELLPEYIFNIMSALYYFVLPTIITIIILVVLPKLLSKNAPTQSQQESVALNQMPQSQIETVSAEQGKEQGIIFPDNGIGTMPATIQSAAFSNEEGNTNIIQAPAVNEVAIQDMVSRAMEPVQKDSTRMQDTIGDLRNEINTIKISMDALSSTVESSLTDLKSFQAELANPLNFMRKYFDSIDIKSLSDPSLPLHVEHLPLSDPIPPISNSEKTEPEPARYEISENNSRSKENENKMKNYDVNSAQNNMQLDLPFKQILGSGITLGKLMTTISLMEEILQTLGRDSIDVLIDQCKMMGLRPEDEHIIYNVINMMDKSGLSVNDTLIMLYKFGKVMNMNDRESDLIYAKLMVNQGKNHDNLLTAEKKAG
ncbi:MAG TPA: hypothetical protein VJ771_00905 [Candidatus Nitrosotalea sp.]|nr:hypothetical protein [Candidatus Nitrosotalea sp.]